MRGLPWNGRAENLKATIVTQQDQGPSGHRRVYLTTKVVAKHGATPDCGGCVGLEPHKEARRVRLEKALADEKPGPVEASVGPITEPATKSQESAPAAQQEPTSSSSGPAAPMPTQDLQNEQMDLSMELGAQERRERRGARPSETPASEISGRPVAKARPASPPMIVPTAEGSGTVVLTAPASSSKDEMTIGGLYMIDGIDVVATLVPEEDVWQFEATETCTTETLMQEGEQEPIAAVDYEDASATEPIEAYDARTGEKLDSEEVRKGRAKEVRELDEFEVKMEVDESEMRATPGKKIWSKWLETRKDPNSSAIRCRLCATEVSTSESRSDTFAATPFEIRATDFELGSELQAQARSLCSTFRWFFHGKVRKMIFVVPPKDLRKKGKSWRLLKSLHGTRDAKQVFATCVEGGLDDHGFQRNAMVPCLYWCATLEALGVHWGDDFIFSIPDDKADDLEQLMREVFKVKICERIGLRFLTAVEFLHRKGHGTMKVSPGRTIRNTHWQWLTGLVSTARSNLSKRSGKSLWHLDRKR